MRKFVVTIEGKSYEVGVEEVTGTPAAIPAAPAVTQIKPVEAAPAEPVKKQAAPAAPVAPAVTGGEKLESPMPGLILGLKVAEGATVKKGDVVLILEAMKMENDITATVDGVISFRVQKGANVNSGDILAVIG